eukprot:ctg_1028.g424
MNTIFRLDRPRCQLPRFGPPRRIHRRLQRSARRSRCPTLSVAHRLAAVSYCPQAVLSAGAHCQIEYCKHQDTVPLPLQWWHHLAQHHAGEQAAGVRPGGRGADAQRSPPSAAKSLATGSARPPHLVLADGHGTAIQSTPVGERRQNRRHRLARRTGAVERVGGRGPSPAHRTGDAASRCRSQEGELFRHQLAATTTSTTTIIIRHHGVVGEARAQLGVVVRAARRRQTGHVRGGRRGIPHRDAVQPARQARAAVRHRQRHRAHPGGHRGRGVPAGQRVHHAVLWVSSSAAHGVSRPLRALAATASGARGAGVQPAAARLGRRSRIRARRVGARGYSDAGAGDWCGAVRYARHDVGGGEVSGGKRRRRRGRPLQLLDPHVVGGRDGVCRRVCETHAHTRSRTRARVRVPIGLLSERGSTSSAWDDAYALFGRLRSGMDTLEWVSDEWEHGVAL